MKKRESAVFWYDDQPLEGRFLVAMPGSPPSFFANTVIFLCAHSSDGAMGFIVNRNSETQLRTLVEKVHSENDTNIPNICEQWATAPVRVGGPVDENRGFVLHSPDLDTPSTIPITDDVSLTSTIAALDHVAEGSGPRNAAVLMGYCGWSEGQLEEELCQNYWLTLDADNDIIFDVDNATAYGDTLGRIGISGANLISNPGNA